MKKNFILFTGALSLLYITLSSDIDGPAHHGHGNITGATSGVQGHCQTSSCHGGNTAQTIVNLVVSDTTTMLPVTTYNALQTYLVTITGNDTAITTTLPGFGFQASAVLGNHTQSGTFSIPTALASQIHTFNCGTTTVVEQTATLAPITTGTNKYSIQFYWTAPAAGSDSTSFFSLLNAVNGDRGSAGDHPNAAPIVTIYEHTTTTTSSTANVAAVQNDFVVFPNPASSNPTIAYSLPSTQEVSVTITDISGRSVTHVVNNEMQQAGHHEYQPQVSVAGFYFVTLTVGDTRITRQFIKQ